ncbi:MAG: HNH endonuclease [Actinomycetota bacterium]|nr:HNH endonuclease [Actinomycetota bacterium]
MTATRPGRGDNAAWRTARKRVLAEEQDCALCGRPLDHTLPRRHPWASEIDHIVPLSIGGAPYDRHNLRAVHRWCHQRRPQMTPPLAAPSIGYTSRSW